MAGTRAATRATSASGSKSSNGRAAASSTNGSVDEGALRDLLDALLAVKDGNFSVRLSERRSTLMGQIGAAFNDLVEMNAKSTKELARIGRLVGREGRMTERFSLGNAPGAWAENAASVNGLIQDLSRPTTEVARVIEAVAHGDLSQKMALKIEGQP